MECIRYKSQKRDSRLSPAPVTSKVNCKLLINIYNNPIEEPWQTSLYNDYPTGF